MAGENPNPPAFAKINAAAALLEAAAADVKCQCCARMLRSYADSLRRRAAQYDPEPPPQVPPTP